MRRLLLSLLASLAHAVVRRQRPRIIGVTGSVGKTSTKEAIRVVLSATRRVRAAPKNYNNEVGLPIAIIGGRAPGRSLVSWLIACMRGCRLALVRASWYPEVLVLEYGADHPGDLMHLVRIAAPSIAVITAVSPAHTEFFQSVERVSAEKQRLVHALPRDGVAVLNHDDAIVLGMRERTRARIVSYGFHLDADVRGAEYHATVARGILTGIAFKLTAEGSTVPVHLTGCLGRGHASAAIAAAAVGTSIGAHLVEIAHALERYAPPPGRMRILDGVKRTTIIDDSYNSSPLALALAVEAVGDAQVIGRRFAVLGDMLELGALTERAHEHAGALVASRRFDYLVTVGAAMRYAVVGARRAGMPADRMLEFHTVIEAGRFVQDLLQPGDTVLVKGSQGMRMERVVQELIAAPLRASDILCRQDDEWLQK